MRAAAAFAWIAGVGGGFAALRPIAEAIIAAWRRSWWFGSGRGKCPRRSGHGPVLLDSHHARQAGAAGLAEGRGQSALIGKQREDLAGFAAVHRLGEMVGLADLAAAGDDEVARPSQHLAGTAVAVAHIALQQHEIGFAVAHREVEGGASDAPRAIGGADL